MKIKIKNKKPPRSLLRKIRAAGMDPDLTRTVFTVGDTIYNPGKQEIPRDLLEHEKVHARRQGDNPKVWWEKYINNPTFRFQEEMVAYVKQYEVICEWVRDKNQRHNVLMEIAGYLSGPTYGKVVSKTTAYSKIKERANVK